MASLRDHASETTDSVPTTTAAPSSTTTVAAPLPATSITSRDAGDENGEAGEAALPEGDLTGRAPPAGADLAVVGMHSHRSLDLRQDPDQGPVVATLSSMASGMTATGRATLTDAGMWYEIRIGDAMGWTSAHHLARLGSTDDITWLVTDSMDGIPSTETMSALGFLMAENTAVAHPMAAITVSGGPQVGDLGEIAMDVTGIKDHPVTGWRLHVFAHPHENGEGFILKSVEITWFCAARLQEPTNDTDHRCGQARASGR